MKDKDYSKLRGRIYEKYGNQRKFATAYGLTYQGWLNKLNGTSKFNQTDIERCCELLDLEADDIVAYFFTPKL